MIDRLGLQVIPHWHRSLIGRGAATRSERDGSRVLEIYPSRYWPGDGLGDHLEFAIKHEGVNLGVLKEVFSNEDRLLREVRAAASPESDRRRALPGSRLPRHPELHWRGLAWGERVHFAGPRPEDLPALMEGLIHSHRAMTEDLDSAVVHAAIVSFGFVFLRPFEDGNGRIHRFLIHNILARRGLTPPGIMLPVSAAMLKLPAEYDESLEAFSRPLMELVEYTLDGEGRLSVENARRPPQAAVPGCWRLRS